MMTYRVAVIGSGPAGLYSADELVRSSDVRVHVDVIDRLPTPYGLVRYGVAPDHPRIKSIIIALQKVLEHERVRFLGNIDIGTDLDARDLADRYDAVLWATGASKDRRMSVPGEDLVGSYSATELVSWYSGHPDRDFAVALDRPSAAVIGAGNVALDVARLLVKTERDLVYTDMPPDVLERLAGSSIRDIHVMCRRGPQHAKFTTKELREFAELEGVDVVLDPKALDTPTAQPLPPVVQANLKVLGELSNRASGGADRRVHFHFWARPDAIVGETRVEGLRLEATEEIDGVIRGTGRMQTLPVGLVFRSVGYRSVPVASVPFDESRGLIPNHRGRVVDEAGEPLPGWYVAGWAKRGPSGVIGTNRACAAETVTSLLSDLGAHRGSTIRDAADGHEPLLPWGVRPVTYDGWLNIDAEEVARGRRSGRARTKIPDWETLRRLGSAC